MWESLVFCHIFALLGNILVRSISLVPITPLRTPHVHLPPPIPLKWVMASVWGLWYLPASRLLVGVSGASGAPATAYLARTVPEGPARMRAMSLQSGAFVLGVLLGPVFQIVFVNFHFTLFGIEFNEYTGAGNVVLFDIT